MLPDFLLDIWPFVEYSASKKERNQWKKPAKHMLEHRL